MKTKHKIVIGDASDMREIKNNSIALVVTSPPYFNAPFDFPDLFESYKHFLDLMSTIAKEIHRVLDEGRIVCLVVDDMLANGDKYPIVADMIKIFLNVGFRYRERITWRKPEGYIRISRRSGVILQHPYPMYFYPDNLQESILILQKGRFDYKKITQLPKEILEQSKIDITEFQKNKWYLSVWDITNVLPNQKEAKYTAVYPNEIVYRLIKLFSFANETILDPFLGSGTTMKVAKELGRNSFGYEVDAELIPIIQEKVGLTGQKKLDDADIDLIVRKDAKRLRSNFRKQIDRKLENKK